MRAWVIGHTGTVESLNSNLNLSEACATAIVKALTADYGISASRLKGYGVGPFAPVASSDSDEGSHTRHPSRSVRQETASTCRRNWGWNYGIPPLILSSRICARR